MKAGARKLRVVLDTNVLISALGFQKKTRKVWELVVEHRFDLFISPFILAEMERNLVAKVGLTPEQAGLIVEEVQQWACVEFPERRVSMIREKEEDNAILECASQAQADVLVTGDRKHIRPLGFFQEIEILTPREFLDKYFPDP